MQAEPTILDDHALRRERQLGFDVRRERVLRHLLRPRGHLARGAGRPP